MVYTKQMYEEERKLVQRLLQSIRGIANQQNLEAHHVLQGTLEDERFIEISLTQNGVNETVSVVVQGLPHITNTYSLIEYDVLSGKVNDTTFFDSDDVYESGRIMWWKNDGAEAIPLARGLQSMLIEAKDWVQITAPNSLFFSRTK